MYTDHKNLEYENSTATSQRAMRWRVLLEEFGPEIVYIKGVHNTVADAISRLDIASEAPPYTDTKQQMCFAMRLFTSTKRSDTALELAVQRGNDHLDIDSEEPFPLDLERVAHEQNEDKQLRGVVKGIPRHLKAEMKLKVINDVEVQTYKDKIYIPASLREKVLNWYHHYLQHPGASRMENTLGSVVYWPNMSKEIRRLCTTCKLCQLAKRTKNKYGKLPQRDLEMRPWHTVCVDCIGPFTIKTKDDKGKIHKRTVRALTIIDPATGWFEIGHIPDDDFNSQRVSQLMNQLWLSRYPRPVRCICDNGIEFKKDFKTLISDFGIKYRPTTVKNPQANGILERVHGVINDMLRTNDLDNFTFDPADPWGDILANVAWALRSLTHSTLNATPGQLVFSRDMLFDLKYVADWQSIRKRKEQQVRRDNERENSKRTNYSYKVGGKVLVKGDHLHILRKTQLLNNGPFIIDEVNKERGTLTITDPNTGTSLPIHIRRVRPFYE